MATTPVNSRRLRYGGVSCVDGPWPARTLGVMSRSSRLRSCVRPIGAASRPQALMDSADRGLISLSGSRSQETLQVCLARRVDRRPVGSINSSCPRKHEFFGSTW